MRRSLKTIDKWTCIVNNKAREISERSRNFSIRTVTIRHRHSRNWRENMFHLFFCFKHVARKKHSLMCVLNCYLNLITLRQIRTYKRESIIRAILMTIKLCSFGLIENKSLKSLKRKRVWNQWKFGYIWLQFKFIIVFLTVFLISNLNMPL